MTNVPLALAKVAEGRDHIETAELCRALNIKPQTARKLHSKKGHVYGLRPRKIGAKLLWPVADVARVLGVSEAATNTEEA